MNDYERVARMIRYLDTNRAAQPDLETLAQHAGLSPFHLHRLFARWAGITPKDFLQCLTLEDARERLRAGESVLAAALASGLSGPGRLHDLTVHLEAATPGELKSGGAGWTIRVGFAASPFGLCFVGETPRGIGHVSFHEAKDRAAGLADVRAEWPGASFVWDDAAAARVVAAMFARRKAKGANGLRAFVRGTAFQVRVWQALLRIPPGALISYGQLAALAGHPSAARAVGSAVGANPLSYLIPCHRVIRETGVLGNYRWDPIRKRALLAREAATPTTAPSLPSPCDTSGARRRSPRPRS